MSEIHRRALDDLTGALRSLDHIKAIAAYGSTATQRWSDGSDIDLLAITLEATPVESLHFFIDGIPVDLSMRNQAEWEKGTTHWLPPNGVAAVWDPEGLLRMAVPRRSSPRDAERYRYSHRHLLLKIKRWQDQDTEVAHLLAAGAPHWIIASYFHARGMRFPGVDQAVPYLRVNDPEILECLLAATQEVEHRVERLTKAAHSSLAPIGGLWRDDEIFVMGWDGTPGEEDASQGISLFQPVVDLAK